MNEHPVFAVYVIKSQRSMTRRPEVRGKEMAGKICVQCLSKLVQFPICFYEEINAMH